ncbi:FAD-binding domain-containing protein [Thermosynechococcus sp. TG252]|uniref:FAD-binding domain-containing protein n=1 Tax=Thermosynechococcus sp. TG252 TaxID=3074097 RepID=UPI002854F0A5|nr:FAD-binding domain-containing protein [Thermosynechococcus sp. TG252]MDR7994158.1 FAD-binding domain-containing protein [Thermosynechococcus sp. TG252]
MTNSAKDLLAAAAVERMAGTRDAYVPYLRQVFADVVGADDTVSETRGGQRAAQERLAKIQPLRYGKSRNFLVGAVTGLSAYLRHGVISLATVRDRLREVVSHPHQAEALLQQLAWRDYWQRLYARWGDRLWQDIEPYKTGWQATDYQTDLPPALIAAETGLTCMDAFSADLQRTGYLHNHARLWLAAYVVHWCRVRWQAGAAWFLQHLLDGDPASNNLSWQWVASTFSHKPYFFNRQNLERYSDGKYCRQCAMGDRCPFDATYEELAARLFPHKE